MAALEVSSVETKDVYGLVTMVLNRLTGRAPFRAAGAAASMVFSLEDDVSGPSDSLVALAIQTIQRAREVSLEDLDARLDARRAETESPITWHVDDWPGEHYRLLAALVSVLRPTTIIEFGTGSGLSALSMKKYLPPSAAIHTFDIRPWPEFRPFTCLRQEDFEDGRLLFHKVDLSVSDVFTGHRGLAERADMWFIDGPKDGQTEPRLLDNLRKLPPRFPLPIMVFDDTRVWNMLALWRGIAHPKLDMTSFGHWLGTGIVEWGGSGGK